ncbi:MAG: adenylate kinase family protein [Methanobrevibacter sp.]|jgi:adenylate kinase|nr:adenylate kinase family protein [Candidatus Methanoflexus mossambicus]
MKNYNVVFISGTPGTGKTTIANNLKKELESKYLVEVLSINEIAIDNNLILDFNEEKNYKVIDINNLNIKLNEIIDNYKNQYNHFISKNKNNTKLIKPKILIVEGHITHLLNGCDKLIVLRLNPKILENRLEKRKYIKEKIQDNLESESLGLCSSEGYELYENKLNEIDTTNKTIEEITRIAIEIIEDKSSLPIGNVDFLDWFLK